MRHSTSSKKEVNNGRPFNDNKPIRIAVIGGKRAGKTSLISNIQWGGQNDTYYPTTHVYPTLVEYTPSTTLARAAFDELSPDIMLNLATEVVRNGGALTLSSTVQTAFQRNKTGSTSSQKLRRSSSTKSNRRSSENLLNGTYEMGYILHSKNSVYATYNTKQELLELSESSNSTSNWPLPRVSPILVELIDTPSFNPDQVVPFIEVSLHKKLAKDELHNLANEPAKPVLANPLLVASGASEMNGNIDGYFFVYSAVPTDHPPSYDEGYSCMSSTGSAQLDGVLTPVATNNSCAVAAAADNNGSALSLLDTMRVALMQAWKEYHYYTSRWNQGQEADIYLFKQAMKNMWKLGSNVPNKHQQQHQQLMEEIPNELPPIWIVCTHTKSPLKAPKLVEEGMKKAKEWGCGFITVDNERPVDECLALMIRDIVETNRSKKKK
ncbi:uncharacterized protein KQ657_001919 [Scheffersomyces spartinae]|uniref:Uncharacterized protein n=1 Tax=Scheffersomyces spartinae TaxID=45513 RepID=A0A9P7V792_9ASCO|nr:uncharacterized protein KQ657_001919 [Scheffersomyces spartinae]KAG7192201.1 hypothetical protein KQ657_001919 [Scheffersomyces spartinae]